MIIKPLNSTHILEHEKLASQAFVFPFDPSKAAELPANTMLGAFTDDKKLAADMEIIDRLCFTDGDTLTCAAVGGVASKPEYRHQGAVRSMLDALFDGSVLGNKWDISILYPFSTAYYYKFGYAPLGTKIQLSVPFSEFSSIPRTNSVKLFTGKDGDDLLNIYNNAAKHCMLSFVRSDLSEWREEPYSTTVYTYIWYDKNGESRSYAKFIPDRNTDTVTVKDIAFIDRESLMGILGFLRCFDGNFSKLVFECLPADTPILNFISDRNKADIKSAQAGAVRILNVMNVLKKHIYPETSGQFSVKVENYGTYTVSYKDGKAEIEITENNPEIILSIAAASKLFLEGVSSERELSFMPDVKFSGNIEDFLKAFPKKNVFFSDPF